MVRKLSTAVALAALVGMGTGCTFSRVAKHFGESHAEMVALQTAEPELAARHAGEPGVDGMDGATAEDVIFMYRKDQTSTRGGRADVPVIVTNTNQLGGGN